MNWLVVLNLYVLGCIGAAVVMGLFMVAVVRVVMDIRAYRAARAIPFDDPIDVTSLADRVPRFINRHRKGRS